MPRRKARDKNEEIAMLVREKRLAKHLSVVELAKLMDKTQGYISEIENGHKLPSIDTLCFLAFFLEFSESEKVGLMSLSPNMLSLATKKERAVKAIDEIRKAKEDIDRSREAMKEDQERAKLAKARVTENI